MREIIKSLSTGNYPSSEIVEQYFGIRGKTWNKEDLVKQIAPKINFSQRDVDLVINTFVQTVTELMTKGDKVVISGLGRFEIQRTNEKRFKHPRTGLWRRSPPRMLPKIRPSDLLKRQIDHAHGYHRS